MSHLVADTIVEIDGPRANLAGETSLVVDPMIHRHLLGLKDLSIAPRASILVRGISPDLVGRLRIQWQRGMLDLRVAHLAVDLVVEPNENLKTRNKTNVKTGFCLHFCLQNL